MSDQQPGPWGDPSEWQTPPPGAGGAPPEAPQPVRTAVNLMYVGAVLAGIQMLLVFTQSDEIRDQLEREGRYDTESEIDSAVSGLIGIGVFFGLVGIGLWIWMAVKNGQGRNWARVTATVFGALNIGLTALGTLMGTAMGTTDTNAGTITGLLSAALAAVILVFLWQPESSRFYEQMRFWGPAR